MRPQEKILAKTHRPSSNPFLGASENENHTAKPVPKRHPLPTGATGKQITLAHFATGARSPGILPSGPLTKFTRRPGDERATTVGRREMVKNDSLRDGVVIAAARHGNSIE